MAWLRLCFRQSSGLNDEIIVLARPTALFVSWVCVENKTRATFFSFLLLRIWFIRQSIECHSSITHVSLTTPESISYISKPIKGVPVRLVEFHLKLWTTRKTRMVVELYLCLHTSSEEDLKRPPCLRICLVWREKTRENTREKAARVRTFFTLSFSPFFFRRTLNGLRKRWIAASLFAKKSYPWKNSINMRSRQARKMHPPPPRCIKMGTGESHALRWNSIPSPSRRSQESPGRFTIRKVDHRPVRPSGSAKFKSLFTRRWGYPKLEGLQAKSHS